MNSSRIARTSNKFIIKIKTNIIFTLIYKMFKFFKIYLNIILLIILKYIFYNSIFKLK